MREAENNPAEKTAASQQTKDVSNSTNAEPAEARKNQSS